MLFDYYGFPEHTYELSYPAPGSSTVSHRIGQLLDAAGIAYRYDRDRGLDHGVFVPFLLMYPDADIPIVQVYALDGRRRCRPRRSRSTGVRRRGHGGDHLGPGLRRPGRRALIDELVHRLDIGSEAERLLVLLHGYGATEHDIASIVPTVDPAGRFVVVSHDEP